MIKRNIIVVFLLFAFTVVLAHSIIPHHHHDDKIETESKDHGHDDENSLEHSFEHYMHAGNSTDYFIQNPNCNNVHFITTVSDISIFIFKNKEVVLPIVSPINSSNDSYLSYDGLFSAGLRGPPLA
jgi:hypothetical protein